MARSSAARSAPILLGALALLVSPSPRAQAQVAGSVPVQQFEPLHPSSGGYLGVSGAGTLGHLRPAGGLWLNYGFRPLEIQHYNPDEQVDLVRHHLAADVALGLGLGERFEVGLELPVALFYAEGEDGFAATPDVSGPGLGDVRGHVTARILGDGGVFNLAAIALVSGPTGDEARYLGSSGLTYEPRLAVESHLKGLSVAGNLGFRIRPATETLTYDTVPIIEVGHEITYGVGASYALADAGLDVIGEIRGRVALSEYLDGSAVPLELGVAARKHVGESHTVLFGLGGGLLGGYGTPLGRVYLGYAFAPVAKSDRDGDGFWDEDDGCPDSPEDVDSWQDDDGCPETDNDKDGLLDTEDKCPVKAEDPDGFEDADGCPDPDNDGDGALDGADQCPLVPEDKDGFNDADGCPEPDNDVDGIPDVDDKCPDDKETINGLTDEDGCPDEGKSKVERTKDSIVILDRVYFDLDKDTIQARSFSILDQVALTLKANPDVTLVEVQGHTDDQAADAYNLDLSQRRAEAVVRYLVDKGVDPARLVARGYGESRPLLKGKSAKAREKNRRVEFLILEVEGKRVAPPVDMPDAKTGAEDKQPLPEDAGKQPLPEDEGKKPLPEDAGKQPLPEDEGKKPLPEEAPGMTLSGQKAPTTVLAFFPAGSAELDARGQGLCETFAAWMKADPKVRVRLVGFTDDTGDAKADAAISMARAQAVQACLVARGVPQKRIEVKVGGTKYPRQPNDSDAHRAENRRVRMLPLDAAGKELAELPVELDVALPTF